MDFPDRNDLFRIERDEALSREGRLSAEVVDRAGSDANILFAGGASAGDEVVHQMAIVAAGLFLDSATGQVLDRLVFDRYGLVRKSAAAALGSVVFTTTAPAGATFVIPAGTKLQTADGLQYVTTAPETFLIATVGPVLAAVRSVLAGKDQQAKIGTITSIVSQIAGQPTDLVVTNTLATAGADDEEDDPSLRARARRFFLTAHKATLAAIEEGALAVPGVRTATAFEVLDVLGRPARFVMLVVTDAYTDVLAQLDEAVPAYETQSQVLTTTIFNALSDVRAAGIYVQVIVGQVILQPVHLSLTFNAGANVDLVALEARAAIVNVVNSLSPGKILRRVDMLNVLRSVPGLIVTGIEISTPLGDVVPRPLQVIRSTLALVTAGAVQSERPLAATVNPDAFVISP